MMTQILKTSAISIGIGFLLQILQSLLDTTYLNDFLSNDLITILIALLAINSATLGIVLTKVRDLVEKHGNAHCFHSAKSQMILSIKEQISLIVFSVIFLTLISSELVIENEDLRLLLNAIVTGIFTYALIVLYDTAKSVLIIIDFDLKK